jgi:hypothetical protein
LTNYCCRQSWSWSLEGIVYTPFATFDALLVVVGGDVRRRLPVTTWGRLTTSLGWAKHACLVAGGALGGDATWLRERVPEEVAMFALSQDLRAALPC